MYICGLTKYELGISKSSLDDIGVVDDDDLVLVKLP